MKYSSTVMWEKQPSETFVDNKYSRKHKWLFDGGVELIASASPQVVPLPFSYENAVDPEEAFVASLASCHMLFFLYFAARHKYIVESYVDHAEGVVGKNAEGKMAMVSVTLHPKIEFAGDNMPSMEQINHLHHLAHEECFISNSVKTNIQIVSS